MLQAPSGFKVCKNTGRHEIVFKMVCQADVDKHSLP